jgi:hypothetical protein
MYCTTFHSYHSMTPSTPDLSRRPYLHTHFLKSQGVDEKISEENLFIINHPINVSSDLFQNMLSSFSRRNCQISKNSDAVVDLS